MIRILMSSCLLGFKVRYHGGDAKINHELLDKWSEEGRIFHFCPEVAAGLPVPRTPSEIVGGDGSTVHMNNAHVISVHGEDKTESFIRGAHLTLSFALAHKIQVAIMKKNSPSCGNTTIYDGSHTGKIIEGSGVTASLLMSNGIKVFNETQLSDVKRYIAAYEL